MKALKDVELDTKVVFLRTERIWDSHRIKKKKCVLQFSRDRSAEAPSKHHSHLVITHWVSYLNVKLGSMHTADTLFSWKCHHMLHSVQK